MTTSGSKLVGCFTTRGVGYVLVGLLTLAAMLAESSSASAQRRRRIPINLTSTPSGAEVFFEGRSIGRTPLRSARLPRGRIELTFRLPNYEEGKLSFDNRRRRKTYSITLQALAVLVVTPGNEAANRAQVRVDGRVLGNVPFRTNMRPGRHHIEVIREGYASYNMWHDVRGGQMLTLPVALKPDTGSILVASDIPGTQVSLDSVPRGETPTVIEGVAVGKHTVELRAEGFPPYQEEVMVVAGQRLTVKADLRATARGTLRILSNVPGAQIRLDGEELGAAPVTREDVPAGEHVLEAVAEGYQPLQQRVTVKIGGVQVVQMDLQGLASAQRIVVSSTVAQAKVRIDGKDHGSPPVIIENAPPGEHSVVITAPGYKDYITTCTIGEGSSCVIDAVLEPTGTPVRFRANVNGAQLFVDGKAMGPVPFEGTIPVGHHRVEVRAPGYQPYVEQVQLSAAAEARVFNVRLLRAGLTPEQMRALARAKKAAVSHAAGILPIDLAILDLSLGWPYLAELRMSVGMLEYLEGGFAARSFGRLTEFELRGELGTRPIPQVGGSVQLRVGGGLGPRSNSFFASLETLGSMFFTDRGAFTLFGGLALYSDDYPYTAANSDVVVGTMPNMMPDPNSVDRQTQSRLRLGGTLEFVLGRKMNVWVHTEGVLAAPQASRRIYGDLFGLVERDTKFYFRLGMSHKF